MIGGKSRFPVGEEPSRIAPTRRESRGETHRRNTLHEHDHLGGPEGVFEIGRPPGLGRGSVRWMS